MANVNLQIVHRGETYEVDLDDAVEPAVLAREFAREAGISSASGGEFRFALLQGKGLVDGATLELVEEAPRSPVTIRRK